MASVGLIVLLLTFIFIMDIPTIAKSFRSNWLLRKIFGEGKFFGPVEKNDVKNGNDDGKNNSKKIRVKQPKTREFNGFWWSGNVNRKVKEKNKVVAKNRANFRF